VDCGALPPEAQAAALFGAVGEPGAFGRAAGGSLLVHGIEHAAPGVQLRLLHVLQERTLERSRVPTDVRLIAASDRDLAAEVSAGRFRDDLHHLLAVTRVHVPPLRERREDVPLLVREILRAANREHARRVPGVTAGVLERLAGHDWPGNVAELKDTLSGMVAAARGRQPLDLDSLPVEFHGADPPGGRIALEVGMTLASAERRLVEATLAYTDGDKRRAAAMLGIGLRTLYRRLDEWAKR
jgi:DNA-binding NtrC family response regulator